MKRPALWGLALLLLLGSGCAKQSPPAPAQSPVVSAPDAAAPVASSPQAPAVLPALSPDRVMGARLPGPDRPLFTSRSHPELLRAVVEALAQAGELLPAPSQTPRFTVHLHLTVSEAWELNPVSADEVVVTTGQQTGTVRSAGLVGALQALYSLVIKYEPGATGWVRAELDPAWVRKEAGPDRLEWVNEPLGLSLSAVAWKSVQVDGAGRWRPADRFPWGTLEQVVPVTVRGTAQSYPALRFRPWLDKTGGPYWGTWPLEISVAGRTGGLSLGCNSTVWTEDEAHRKAAQAAVDQRCPVLLQQFTVDLGEPVAPEYRPVTVPEGQPAVLTRDGAGWRLTAAPGINSLAWPGQRGPMQWQFFADENDPWLLDLARGEIRRDPGAPKGTPLGDGAGADQPVGRLADGRSVAHRGGRTGDLIAWREADPAAVERLSPAGVFPFFGSIAPDGKRLVYFHAETPPPADYPRATAVALLDLTTGTTTVQAFPEPAYVDRPTWDPAGHLTLQYSHPQRPVVYQLRPDGSLVPLTPPGWVGKFLGWDGCGLVSWGNGGLFRHHPPGCGTASDSGTPARLAASHQETIFAGDLIAFPNGNGMDVLDLRTGRRYRAPGLVPPSLPLPPWLQLGALRPESGYVALQTEMLPQVVYEIVPVTPLPSPALR